MSIQPAQPRAITAPPKRVWLLNAAHRCDGCGSRAYVYLVLKTTERLPDGGSLLMCAHHARQHWPRIKPLVWMAIDESALSLLHFGRLGALWRLLNVLI